MEFPERYLTVLLALDPKQGSGHETGDFFFGGCLGSALGHRGRDASHDACVVAVRVCGKVQSEGLWRRIVQKDDSDSCAV